MHHEKLILPNNKLDITLICKLLAYIYLFIEAAVRKCSAKLALLKIVKNSQEKTRARVSFYKVAELYLETLLKRGSCKDAFL